MNYQSSDVVEALVREYLVRAGCTSALDAFNREKPKHSNSITKREILRKALGLDKAAAYYKKLNPASEGIPSTIEVSRSSRSSVRIEDEPEGVSVPVPATVAPRRHGSGSGSGSGATAATGVVSRPVQLRQGFGDVISPKPVARPPATRRMSTPSPDDDEEPEIIHHAMPRGPVGGSARTSLSGAMPSSASYARASPPNVGPGASALASRTSSGLVGGGAFAQAPPRAPVSSRSPAAAGTPRPAGAGSSSRHSGDLVMEDVGDIGLGDADAAAGPTAALANMRISGPTLRKPGNPISPDVMRQLRQLLWGTHGQPPPSWKQGFFFNRNAGLQFGLVQRQGGPCGVLAGLQGHVLAALYSPATGFNTTPRIPEQQSALATAITESLWQARMGPTASLILPEGEAGGAAGRLGYDQMSRAVAQHTASSREALMDLVRASLAVFMAEDGWGIVFFVMSLALTRGVVNVQSDMDEPGNSLLGAHGYCTQDLVNLVLLGSATSNVFDGNRQLDGSTTLKGIGRRCRLGLLTLFEWYKYVEVGASLKNPTLPVWVVCSESHFTVLFAQDNRALQNQLPFDLIYYDELANQDTVIRLSVSKDPRGGWTARVGDTIGERGKCEGQNIPPLECVIETRWPGVKVNWNGHDPIL